MLKNTNRLLTLLIGVICFLGVLPDLRSYASEFSSVEMNFNEDCWKNIKSMRGFGTDIVIGNKSCPIDDLHQCSDEIDDLDSKQVTKLFEFIYKKELQNTAKIFSQTRNFHTKNYLLNLYYMSSVLDSLDKKTYDAFKKYADENFSEDPLQSSEDPLQSLIRNIRNLSPSLKKKKDPVKVFTSSLPNNTEHFMELAAHTGATDPSLGQLRRDINTKYISSINFKLDEIATYSLENIPELDKDLELEEKIQQAYVYIDLEVKKYFIINFHNMWDDFYKNEINNFEGEDRRIQFKELMEINWDGSKKHSDFSRVVWHKLLGLKSAYSFSIGNPGLN